MTKGVPRFYSIILIIHDNEYLFLSEKDATKTGLNVLTSFEEPGRHIIRAEASVNGEWLSSAIYEIDVVSYGSMPPVENLPAAVNSIGAYAFYGCRSITSVAIPAGVEYIDPSFAYTDITLRVSPDSYAEEFCKQHGVPYQLMSAE